MNFTVDHFLKTLQHAPDKELVFEYEADTFVPMAYHITEVKNVHIESVDCGGRPDAYDQTIVQLWVRDGEHSDRHMTAAKALKIFDIVDAKKPMKKDTPVFFEWGHGSKIRTSVYAVEEIVETESKLILQLFVPATVCKPVVEELVLVNAEGGCSPGGGCC
jgi:hypothetical protein